MAKILKVSSEPSDYENLIYQLSGVIIHCGTADLGHYYSLIRERKTDKWLEFNDISIKDFDYRRISEVAFGRAKDSYLEKINQERAQNAYLLFYELKSEADSKRNKIDMEFPLNKFANSEKNNYQFRKMAFDENLQFFIKNLLDSSKNEREKQLSIGKIGVIYFLLIGLRLKERDNIYKIFMQLKLALFKNISLALWFLNQFTNISIINEFLIDLPIKENKYLTFGLFKKALLALQEQENILKLDEYESSCEYLDFFKLLLNNVFFNQGNIDLICRILSYYSTISPNFCKFLLRNNFLLNSVHFLNSKIEMIHDFFTVNEINSELSYNNTSCIKRMKGIMTKKNSNYDFLTSILLDLLLSITNPDISNPFINEKFNYNIETEIIIEVRSESFLKQLLEPGRKKINIKKIGLFLCSLSFKQQFLSLMILDSILEIIEETDELLLNQKLEIVFELLHIKDEFSELRVVFY